MIHWKQKGSFGYRAFYKKKQGFFVGIFLAAIIAPAYRPLHDQLGGHEKRADGQRDLNGPPHGESCVAAFGDASDPFHEPGAL